jgi:hypothetical protein
VNENRNVPAQAVSRHARLATLSALLVLTAMVFASRYARAEDIRFAVEMAGWAMMAAIPNFTE